MVWHLGDLTFMIWWNPFCGFQFIFTNHGAFYYLCKMGMVHTTWILSTTRKKGLTYIVVWISKCLVVLIGIFHTLYCRWALNWKGRSVCMPCLDSVLHYICFVFLTIHDSMSICFFSFFLFFYGYKKRSQNFQLK